MSGQSQLSMPKPRAFRRRAGTSTALVALLAATAPASAHSIGLDLNKLIRVQALERATAAPGIGVPLPTTGVTAQIFDAGKLVSEHHRGMDFGTLDVSAFGDAEDAAH